MKNPFFEKPQKGNPHKLTIFQHIIPKMSIERFCGDDGFVEVLVSQKQGFVKLKPESEFFCVKRLWSQKAEISSIQLESAFQDIAESVTKNNVNSLSQEMQYAVTKFYLLLRLRCIYASNPLPDESFSPFISGSKLTKDEQERFESFGFFYIRDDATMPSRAVTEILMQAELALALEDGAEKFKWGVIRAHDETEFLCPDSIINQPLLPISPNVCLVSGWQSGFAKSFDVANINKALVKESKSYLFAKSLVKCQIS